MINENWQFSVEQWLCLQHLHDVCPQDGGGPQAAGGRRIPPRLLPGGRAVGRLSHLKIMGQVALVNPSSCLNRIYFLDKYSSYFPQVYTNCYKAILSL